jgi:hypothetical protein
VATSHERKVKSCWGHIVKKMDNLQDKKYGSGKTTKLNGTE